jgi:7-carboxy-7-deazaguanine synthase
MTYRVNEIFYSIQGEGHWTGRPAVFLRFSGCNLWSGVEAERENAICTFCDTDFVSYQTYDADELAAVMRASCDSVHPMAVITGGEPLLQLDDILVSALHRAGFYIAIETNGTLPLTVDIDWVCVSPKTPSIRITAGNELKLVYPQCRIVPEKFADLNFDHLWLSPMDGPKIKSNTELAYHYCLLNPQWRLNIQTHKVIGVR